MARRALEIHPNVRLKAESLGQPGRAWLAGLAGQVAELEERWGIEVGSRQPADVTTCSDIDMMSTNADGRFVHKDGTPYQDR